MCIRDRFYTYDDKYKNGVSQTVIPAHLPEAKLDEVKTYAAMAYTALNCEGLALSLIHILRRH